MDRHVAVTGASSGLGEAIARAFPAAGCEVARLTYPRGYAPMRWLPGPAGFFVGRFGPRPVTPEAR